MQVSSQTWTPACRSQKFFIELRKHLFIPTVLKLYVMMDGPLIDEAPELLRVCARVCVCVRA